MIIGAKYMLKQTMRFGSQQFDPGEVFTLVSYNSDSDAATLKRDGRDDVEYSTNTNHLILLEWSIPTPSKPAHYDTGIDTIAFLRANCPPEQVEGFLRGNALKYLQRYDKKNGLEDLRKAKHYVEMLIKELEGRE